MTCDNPYTSFPLIAGNDDSITIAITDCDGAVVDLSGATIRFLAYTPNDQGIVLDSAASPQTATITVTNDVGGVLVVALADTDTAALLGDYKYELKVTLSGAEQVTNQGIITFEASAA